MVSTLEDLCVTHLVKELEQYPVELLSLLPLTIRHRLLLRLPLVDICHLEQTSVFQGIECDTIWGELYETHFPRYWNNMYLRGIDDEEHECDVNNLILDIHSEDKKELYLTTLSQIILNNLRPTGYFGHFLEYRSIFAGHFSCNAPGALEYASDDVVNYLIASCRARPTRSKSLLSTESLELLDYADSDGPPSPGAFAKAIPQYLSELPPSELYEKACRQWQLVPPRYASLLQHNSGHLPDLEALRLLMEGCNFYPKAVAISSSLFDPLYSVWASGSAAIANCLANIFSEVEKLFLSQEGSHVLRAVFSNPHPVLSTLHLYDFDLHQLLPYLSDSAADDDSTQQQDLSIEAVGESSRKHYTGLKELRVKYEYEELRLNELEAVVQCQNSLECLKIHGSVSISSKTQTVLVSFLRKSQYQLCLEYATLNSVQELIATFLSSPCHGRQTLLLSCCSIEGPWSHLQSVSQEASSSCALEHKFLILDRCQYSSDSYTESEVFPLNLLSFHLNTLDVSGFGPISYAKLFPSKSWLCLLAQHPDAHVENLILDRAPLSGTTKKDCELVLQDPALRKLNVDLCDLSLEVLALALRKVAASSHLCTLIVHDRDNLQPLDQVRLFFDVLFSLPNLPQLAVTLNFKWNDEMFQVMYETWKKNGIRPKWFSLPFLEDLHKEKFAIVLKEMCIDTKPLQYEQPGKSDFIEVLCEY